MAKIIDLILKDIDDEYVRENFTRVQRLFNNENILNGNFKFFEVELTGANTILQVPHGLTFIPSDIIFLSVEGDYNFYFVYSEFDKTNIHIFISGPCKLRFFAGAYKDPSYGRMVSDLTLVPPNAASGIGTTWFTGSGAPLAGLGSIGDFYLDTDPGSKKVYYKTGAVTWTLQGNILEIHPASDISLDTSPSRNAAIGDDVQEFVDRLFEESESQAPTYNVDGTINFIQIYTSPVQINANRTSRVDFTYDVDLQPTTETWSFYSLADGTTVIKTVTITYTWAAGVLTNQTQVTA